MGPAAVVLAVLTMLGTERPADPTVRLDESFTLRAGGSARIESDGIQVEFERVVADSRCPKGAQCIVEGDATVRVVVRKGSATTSHDLHTAENRGQESSDHGFTVRLLRLDPYPVEGKTIAPEDYEATLEITRGSSAPAANFHRP
jgi:hypothetical protein